MLGYLLHTGFLCSHIPMIMLMGEMWNDLPNGDFGGIVIYNGYC